MSHTNLPSHRFNDMGDFRGLYRGHHAAIQIANDANKGKDSAFKLGDLVFLSNGVDHGEGPYSQDIEDGAIRLRPVNMPGQPAKRSIDLINARYGDGISTQQASRLRTKQIGT